MWIQISRRYLGMNLLTKQYLLLTPNYLFATLGESYTLRSIDNRWLLWPLHCKQCRNIANSLCPQEWLFHFIYAFLQEAQSVCSISANNLRKWTLLATNYLSSTGNYGTQYLLKHGCSIHHECVQSKQRITGDSQESQLESEQTRRHCHWIFLEKVK